MFGQKRKKLDEWRPFYQYNTKTMTY